MKNTSTVMVAALWVVLVPSACTEIAGLKDYQVGPEETGGAGGVGGVGGGMGGMGGSGGGMGGMAGMGGVGGMGGAMLCEPNSSAPCYTGPPGTENVGACALGTWTCNAEGTAYGPCMGEVVPTTESCATQAIDESCDNAPSCTGSPAWSKVYEGGSSTTFDVAADADGNVYAIGVFAGVVDFGGGPVSADGTEDVFVLKLDKTGVFGWLKRFGDVEYQYGQSIAVDAAGDVIIAGYFTGSIDFGGGALASQGTEDIFIAKLDAAGGHVWSKVFGDAVYQNALSVAVDGAGNAILTGYFDGTVDFGGGPLTTGGEEDIFVVKLGAADGAHQWSKRFGGPAKQFGVGVAVDSADNVLLVGSFSGSVDLGGGPLTSAGSDDVLVAKLDSAGNYVWASRHGDSDDQSGVAVAADSQGNVLVTGHFKGSLQFGGSNLSAGAAEDIYVAKLTSGGAHVWSKDFGDAAQQFGQAIAVDGEGNVVITGYFSGSAMFGGGSVTSVDGRDIYAVKLDPAGGHLWNKRFGDLDHQFGQAIAVDALGNVVLGGYVNGTVDFGGGAITVANDTAYVVKLLP